MTLQTSTLRPGLLVVAKTKITGNVRYYTTEIVAEHITENGELKKAWETEKLVSDAAEHARAVKVKSKSRDIIRAVCAETGFGYLCPERSRDDLDRAIVESRKLVADFNSTASITFVEINVMIGKVSADDLDAVRAINGEVRELLDQMKAGIIETDVERIREAANRAKQLSEMLSAEAQATMQVAIDMARKAAVDIKKAEKAETPKAEIKVDIKAVAQLIEARGVFLDLDDADEVQAPSETGRAIDLDEVVIKTKAAPAVALEL